jgi:hypothetical protein
MCCDNATLFASPPLFVDVFPITEYIAQRM